MFINMNIDIVKQFYPDYPEWIAKGCCPICHNKIGEFKDDLSKKEYEISGMCQDCQDEFFDKGE